MYLRDPIVKKLFRRIYSIVCGFGVACNTMVPRRKELSVYFGGARRGNVGGPLVKIKRLREHFPERAWGYNAAYVLSNAPYLPKSALQLLKWQGIPIVHNQNGVFYGAWFDGDWEAQNARMAIPYRMADHVFYQSEFCRCSAERFLGDREGPGEILYNAVDTATFFPDRTGTRRTPRPFTFLVTGKIDDHLYYRLESTIEGLKLARNAGLQANLLIAGWIGGRAMRQAEELASSLGLQEAVAFAGSYTQEAAPALYRSADAYVMTKHNDPCPNTVLEALATGMPVLYSDSGGVPELVGSEAGIALPCEQGWDRPYAPSAAAIGDGMIRIAAERASYAEAARQRAVERFDIAHWIDRHREVFERLREERK